MTVLHPDLKTAMQKKKKNGKNHIVQAVPKSNRKIVETETKYQ